MTTTGLVVVRRTVRVSSPDVDDWLLELQRHFGM
jgi:hypothetical protein